MRWTGSKRTVSRVLTGTASSTAIRVRGGTDSDTTSSAPHLRAVAIADWLTTPAGSASVGPRHLSRTMRGEADGQGFVLEQVLTLLDPDSLDDVISQ